MLFEIFPLRFEFIARQPLDFPAGKAANTLRGALGTVLKGTPDSHIFAPGDSPRPFVFRARHLNGSKIEAGQSFHFDLHLFSPGVREVLTQAFADIASEGLGPRRAKLELQHVRQNGPIVVDLAPPPQPTQTVRVEFLSPTELKHENHIAPRPEFPILFARIRDRISTLRALYGPGHLVIDRASGERAAKVRMTHCEIRRQDAGRRSSRTGQSHSLGGFVGVAEYEGELGELMPYLEAGQWIGVGRHAVWGKGEIRVTPNPTPPAS
jgi:hypothetical protein